MAPYKFIIEIIAVCCILIALLVISVITFKKLPELRSKVQNAKSEKSGENVKTPNDEKAKGSE